MEWTEKQMRERIDQLEKELVQIEDQANFALAHRRGQLDLLKEMLASTPYNPNGKEVTPDGETEDVVR